MEEYVALIVTHECNGDDWGKLLDLLNDIGHEMLEKYEEQLLAITGVEKVEYGKICDD